MTPSPIVLDCLTGLSVGDALGQCLFSLSAEETERILAGQALPEAPWFYTDDTEMALSVVSVLTEFDHIEADVLARRFAERYSYDRAYGPAMHRALARIREGEPWQIVSHSLFEGQGSFGNGAAMRVAPIGAFFADEPDALCRDAALSAEITHAHPEAIAGAIAVAAAAAAAVQFRAQGRPPGHEAFLGQVLKLVPVSEVRTRLLKAQNMVQVQSLQYPASVLGTGLEMAAHDTVPFALWCCAQSLDDFERAIYLGLEAGVDRDTLGAIIGGVVACHVGQEGIPREWQRRREPWAER